MDDLRTVHRRYTLRRVLRLHVVDAAQIEPFVAIISLFFWLDCLRICLNCIKLAALGLFLRRHREHVLAHGAEVVLRESFVYNCYNLSGQVALSLTLQEVCQARLIFYVQAV